MENPKNSMIYPSSQQDEFFFLILSSFSSFFPSQLLSTLFIQGIPERTGFLGDNPPSKDLFPMAHLGASHWLFPEKFGFSPSPLALEGPSHLSKTPKG